MRSSVLVLLALSFTMAACHPNSRTRPPWFVDKKAAKQPPAVKPDGNTPVDDAAQQAAKIRDGILNDKTTKRMTMDSAKLVLTPPQDVTKDPQNKLTVKDAKSAIIVSREFSLSPNKEGTLMVASIAKVKGSKDDAKPEASFDLLLQVVDAEGKEILMTVVQNEARVQLKPGQYKLVATLKTKQELSELNVYLGPDFCLGERKDVTKLPAECGK